MLTEINLGGIFVATFAWHLALALPVFFALRWLLTRLGLLPRLWYLALSEVALFVLVLFLTFPLVPQ
ncbi:hypothetical protein GALL_78580 [mine drainage metagenome]|uniref:DUF1656 domain-containing protein n=1 Tax=mine drainage metagenome TaxID=410659 RepID=A0A1J5SN69_9ZZZZ